jgi:hypothetical protein
MRDYKSYKKCSKVFVNCMQRDRVKVRSDSEGYA